MPIDRTQCERARTSGDDVLPRWTKALIELYTEEGYQGCWEGTPNPERGGWNPADLPHLAKRIREDMGYADAFLQYCEDGETLVIGVFDGTDPPRQPRKGSSIVPDTFEDYI